MRTPNFAVEIAHLKSVLTILILVCALHSEAQEHYRLLIKGQPSPFDSAVAVRLDRYREETKKLALGQQLIDSLKEEVVGLMKENALRADAEQTNMLTISELTRANARKDSVNRQLQGLYNQLDAAATKFEKTNTKLTIGLTVVLILQIIRMFVN